MPMRERWPKAIAAASSASSTAWRATSSTAAGMTLLGFLSYTCGMILDVSARGLFVRTSTGSAPREPGTEVRVVVRSADGEPFELMARLARAHVVRRELVSAADGGFGLEITSAPEAWFALLRDIV